MPSLGVGAVFYAQVRLSLSAISLVGLAEQAGIGGLFFGTIEAEFLLTEAAILVRESAATGPSLGVSLNGRLDLDNKTMDLQGPFDAPQTRVNPLSALTPGVFRNVFRRDPPELGQGVSPQ